jgi:hypothetical protein
MPELHPPYVLIAVAYALLSLAYAGERALRGRPGMPLPHVLIGLGYALLSLAYALQVR